MSGHGMWGAAEVAKADWIRVKAAGSDLMITLQHRAGLGSGEVSTVLLAKELKADLALMDDRKARALAVKFGVTPIGCIGILQSAFLAGLLTDLRKAYQLLLGSGAYANRGILEASLKSLNLPQLDD